MRAQRFAKLTIPHASHIVRRDRLFEVLETGGRRRVVWIVGPPGAGKTALLATWLEERKPSNLWVQLDEGDSDVASFFYYLKLAADALLANGAPPFAAAHLTNPGGYARLFFRKLCADENAPHVIVLDDYHEIRDNSPLHAALREGFHEIAMGTTIVVLSRAEPPPTFARLIANEVLQTIHAHDLNLSDDEAIRIGELWGFATDKHHFVKELNHRVHGWAAGLVLALIDIKAGTSHEHQSNHSGLFAYFDEEVLAKADTNTRSLLLQTAFLPRVSGPIASELTGIGNAGAILSDLSRRGYFVASTYDDEPTYVYHALFRDFLISKAEHELTAARRMELYRSAADLLEVANQIDDALKLYQLANDWPNAARNLCTRAPTLIQAGRADKVASLILAIPELEREKNTWLQLWLGAALTFNEPKLARTILGNTFDRFRKAGDSQGAFLTWVTIVGACWRNFDALPLLDHWLLVLDEIEHEIANLDPEIMAQVVGAVIMALGNRQPFSPRRDVWERRAHSMVIGATELRHRAYVALPLVQYYVLVASDFHRAKIVFDAIDPIMEQLDATSRLNWYVGTSALHCFQGDFPKGLLLADNGLQLGGETGLQFCNTYLLYAKCVALVCSGLSADATQCIREMATSSSAGGMLERGCYHSTASIVARQNGNDDEAHEHAQAAVQVASPVGWAYPLMEAQMTIAFTEPLPSRRAAIENVLALAIRFGNRLIQATCLLELAVLLSERDESSAVEYVRSGFQVGDQAGIRGYVHLKPDELRRCCALALKHGMAMAHVQEVARVRAITLLQFPVAVDGIAHEVRLEALGGFRVLDKHGAALQLGRKTPKKLLLLLKLLVASGPGGAHPHALADILWPDAEGDAAQHSLDTSVYRLRRLLGSTKGVIITQGRIALGEPLVSVDAWALERVLDDTKSVDTQQVQQLFVGDLFGIDETEPSLVAARERLRARVDRIISKPC